MSVVPISLAEVEYTLYEYAKEVLKFDEPLPEFNTRSPGLLESCISQPFQSYDGKDLYESFYDKATILFYLMIKNHPFQNGNKRMALMTLMVFLYKNGYWIKTSPMKIYEFACMVSESKPADKASIILLINNFIKKYSVKRRIVMG